MRLGELRRRSNESGEIGTIIKTAGNPMNSARPNNKDDSRFAESFRAAFLRPKDHDLSKSCQNLPTNRLANKPMNTCVPKNLFAELNESMVSRAGGSLMRETRRSLCDAPNSTRNRVHTLLTSGVSHKNSEFFVSLVENTARMVGIAAFSIFSGTVLLSETIDNCLYENTISFLSSIRPKIILLRRSNSMLLSTVETHFPDSRVETLGSLY